MNSRVAYYFVAFAIVIIHTMILPVKGQPTTQSCENGDSPSSMKAELNSEAIRELNLQLQNIRELLAESNQERQRQQDRCLQAVDRRSQEQIRDHGVSFQEMKDQLDNVTTSLESIDRRSQEQMKSQHDTVLRSLEAIDRRLNDNDICFNNKTQTASKLGIVDPDQLPIVNNWIVFLNRSDGSLDFNRNWSEYKNGFGDIGRGEFWLGNEIVHHLTNTSGVNYALRIEVQLNATGQWFYAEYATFSLDSENDKYALHLSGFSGNAGDSLTDTSVSGGIHNGKGFSTKDADNDRWSLACAHNYQAGWWYDECGVSCLTCQYGSKFNWRENPYGSWQGRGLLRAARIMFKSI